MPHARRRAAKYLTASELGEQFEISNALITTDSVGAQHLLILSGDPSGGRVRVSTFGPDGPIGHHEASSMQGLLELVADNEYVVLAEPVGDAEVVAWTSTPEFLDGARRVAYTMAWNEAGFAISKAAPEERAELYAQKRAIDDLSSRDLEAATRMMRELARKALHENPCCSYVANPTPWVTRLLGGAYEQLEEMVPPKWLPKLTKTKGKGTTFTGKLEEFGCGAYGCVLPTLDRGVVLKVTSDESEADFAKRLAPILPTPIVTAYYQIADLRGAKYKGAPVFLLWREEAEEVGKIDEVVGQHAEDAIAKQHAAATAAFTAIMVKKHGDASDEWLVPPTDAEIAELMNAWRAAARAMAKIPELAFVAHGLLAAEAMGVFISDTHGGNLGVCMRNGQPTWVITDPGNVVVTNPKLAS